MPAYTLIVPKTEEKFTEFYINNPDGQPTEYTWDTALGEEREIILGTVNREQKQMSYRVQVNIDGTVNNMIGPLSLEYEEKWKRHYSLFQIPPEPTRKLSFCYTEKTTVVFTRDYICG